MGMAKTAASTFWLLPPAKKLWPGLALKVKHLALTSALRLNARTSRPRHIGLDFCLQIKASILASMQSWETESLLTLLLILNST